MVFTDKDSESDLFDGNYNIIPERVQVGTSSGLLALNCNGTNLYEFMINSLVSGKDTYYSTARENKLTHGLVFLSYNFDPLLFKGNSINYNMFSTKVTNNATNVTVTDFDTNSIIYNFGTDIYNSTGKDYLERITSTFYQMDTPNPNGDSYSKVNYRDFKYFKLPIHSETPDHYNNCHNIAILGFNKICSFQT